MIEGFKLQQIKIISQHCQIFKAFSKTLKNLRHMFGASIAECGSDGGC